MSSCSADLANPKINNPMLKVRMPVKIKGRRPYLSDNTPMGIWGIAINTMNEPMIIPIMGFATFRSAETAGSIGINDRIAMNSMNSPMEIIDIILVRWALLSSMSGIGNKKLVWVNKFSQKQMFFVHLRILKVGS